MTVIYVAGPMTGLPDFNYPAFDAAAANLEALGHEVLNPTSAEKHNDTGAPQAWDWYMRRALYLVIQADAIALLPGWENSRGATLEHQIGVALGLDIRTLGDWLAAELIDASLQSVDALQQLDQDVSGTASQSARRRDGVANLNVGEHGGESKPASDLAVGLHDPILLNGRGLGFWVECECGWISGGTSTEARARAKHARHVEGVEA